MSDEGSTFPPLDAPGGYAAATVHAVLGRLSLLVLAVAAGVAAAASVAEYRLIGRLIDSPRSVTISDLEASDNRKAIAFGVLTALILLSAVVVLVWKRRFDKGQAVLQRERSSPLSLRIAAVVWVGGTLLGRLMDPSSADNLSQVQGFAAVDGIRALVIGVVGILVSVDIGRHMGEQQKVAEGVEALGGGPLAMAPNRPAEIVVPAFAIVASLATGIVVFGVGGDDGVGEQSGPSSGQARSAMMWELDVGDCWNADLGSEEVTEILAVEVVPCSEPHSAQTFATVEPFAQAAREFPGDDELTAEGMVACGAQLEGFVGVPLLESGYTITISWPTEDGWSQGRRRIECVLERGDAGPMASTARGSGSVLPAGHRYPTALAVGTCVNDTGWLIYVEVVSCDRMHDAQLFHIGTLTAGPAAPVPGSDVLLAQATSLCDAHLDSSVRDPRGLEWGPIALPLHAAWAEGDRSVACALWSTSGTLAGSRVGAAVTTVPASTTTIRPLPTTRPAPTTAPGPKVLRVEDSVKLDGDHDGPVVIASDGVVLDCGGHTIRGTGDGTGILLSGVDDVTVRDCVVVGFGVGVLISGSDTSGNTVTESLVEGNSSGFVIAGASSNTLSANRAVGNPGNGVRLESGATSNIIRDNEIIASQQGVHLRDAHSNVIEDNLVEDADNWFGIGLFDASTDNQVAGNTVIDSGIGIVLNEDSNDNLIINNVVENGGTAYALGNVGYNELIDNTAIGSDGNGYELQDTTDVLMRGNTAESVVHKGIAIHRSHRTTIERNTLTGGREGVNINLGTDNIVRSNTATGNRDVDFLDDTRGELDHGTRNHYSDNTCSPDGSRTVSNPATICDG